MIGEELGKYRVLAPIGKGGMASVFVGEHTLLGHKVAIKVLQKRHLDNPAIERRFFNEAVVIASIRHSNIVEIFDFGRSERGAAYIVMELLEGQTLRSRIRRGIMPERQSILFMRQLASALAEAHHIGVIHRDLKPDNIFIIADEEVELGERIKLLDFGIAKRIEPDGFSKEPTEQTATGILVGTPAYMSPEQCKGLGDIDGRSDVYSLGVVLYRMLTNQLPFEAQGTGELIGKHLFVEPSTPREMNPDISIALEEIIMRCLRKEPEQRFQTMGDLANAFADLISADTTRHIAAAPPRRAEPSHPTPSGERLASQFSPMAALGLPLEEISATTLRTATGEQLSPAYQVEDLRGGRSWALWTAIGCIAAMLIGVVALSTNGDDAAKAASEADEAGPTAAGAKAAPRDLEVAPVAAAIAEGANPAETATDKAADKAAAEKLAAEEVAADKLAAENAAADKLAADKADKLAADKADKLAADKLAAAKLAATKKVRTESGSERAEAAKRAAEARREREAEERRAEEKRQAAAADAAKKAKEEAAKKAREKEQKQKKTFDDVKTPVLF